MRENREGTNNLGNTTGLVIDMEGVDVWLPDGFRILQGIDWRVGPGEHWALLGVLMISSLLNIAYLLPIPIRAFLGRPPEGKAHSELREAPVTCLLAMAVTSLACVLLFFYPDPFYQLAAVAVGAP